MKLKKLIEWHKDKQFEIDTIQFKIENGKMYYFLEITYQWLPVRLHVLTENQISTMVKALTKEA